MSQIVKEDGNVRITPGIDIVASTCTDLRQELLGLINEGQKKIIIDLQDTAMIDSSGIGLLIYVKNCLVDAGGGEVEIVHISDDIMELFLIMRLENHFVLRNS
ncbi:MAG: STAS domain-containing protein [Proteobacteria bacterium]|nr:STAS domain-containing protein [Pseudomonadota bacterium]MBU1641285.1 STAS domain-containing protein [Pseudomonadota bacterium]